MVELPFLLAVKLFFCCFVVLTFIVDFSGFVNIFFSNWTFCHGGAVQSFNVLRLTGSKLKYQTSFVVKSNSRLFKRTEPRMKDRTNTLKYLI